jgi:hypothetical protein
MLPCLEPPAPVPSEGPSKVQVVLEEFDAWLAREQRKGVPFWNPWKPADAADRRDDMPGALVEVWGRLPPLETETQEVLRLTVAWIIAHRLDGLGVDPTPLPLHTGAANWEATHPGGNRVAGLAPLGWRRWR